MVTWLQQVNDLMAVMDHGHAVRTGHALTGHAHLTVTGQAVMTRTEPGRLRPLGPVSS